MKNRKCLFEFDLQLFADGGGDGGSVGGTGSDGASGVSEGASLPSTTKGAKSNPLASVQYGKQSSVPDAGVQKDSVANVTPDREAMFDDLIKGEYKDQYNKRVESIVQSRLKNSKETVEKYNALTPMFDMLASKYGISDKSDVNAIMQAIQEDDSYYEDEALEKGLTVEQLKEVKRMERENAELKRQIDARQRQENTERIFNQWTQQAESVKQLYPSFDLNAEVRNPKFAQLLQSGIDVRTAFEVVHKDEIIPAAMQYTAQNVERKLANKIASGNRPVENGINSQAASLVKSDVSQLTKADRAEIIRRVARGEKITF